jgi:hypothetical protein
VQHRARLRKLYASTGFERLISTNIMTQERHGLGDPNLCFATSFLGMAARAKDRDKRDEYLGIFVERAGWTLEQVNSVLASMPGRVPLPENYPCILEALQWSIDWSPEWNDKSEEQRMRNDGVELLSRMFGGSVEETKRFILETALEAERRELERLREMGQRLRFIWCSLSERERFKGDPDIGWRYHGLWLELKRRSGGRVIPEQREWIHRLRGQGYRAEVARGWEEARDSILDYLAESP